MRKLRNIFVHWNAKISISEMTYLMFVTARQFPVHSDSPVIGEYSIFLFCSQLYNILSSILIHNDFIFYLLKNINQLRIDTHLPTLLTCPSLYFYTVLELIFYIWTLLNLFKTNSSTCILNPILSLIERFALTNFAF